VGRRYYIPLPATAVSAAIDLLEILAAAGKPFRLVSVKVSQSSDYGDAQAEGLSISIKRATGSYTSGSGGSTVTPAKQSTNDPAAGPTAETFNASQAAAGSGALTTIDSDAFNVQAGYLYLPPENDQPLFLPTEACVISMTVPNDSITVSGTAVIEEL
jgi:hypothetical protein